ncbi:MAG TPA: hypothetical protein VFQ38_07475 [Longimicrobiales bacterium]|nr:hypothetical protein [Longimicrobiales bacterium]
MRFAIMAFATLLLAAGCRSEPTAAPASQLSPKALAVAINQEGGRAFVGFKEANATVGVDERGRVLVSAETVARMKEYLRGLGLEVLREWDKPFVVVRMNASESLVSALLSHPNIQYVEPIVPGKWD